MLGGNKATGRGSTGGSSADMEYVNVPVLSSGMVDLSWPQRESGRVPAWMCFDMCNMPVAVTSANSLR